jgi:hypothetical protein
MMVKPWVAAIGSLKGWLLAIGLWVGLAVAYVAITTPSWSRSRIWLDQSLGEVIRCGMPVQAVIGEFSDPGDAADDYHRAVQECIATQHYSGYMALLTEASREKDPDSLDIRAPQYLLDGAKKARMNYTPRFSERQEWTAARIPFVKAFDTIGQMCIIKANLLAKAGRTDQAEALLRAVIAFGYHIEQERIRYSQTITGVALEKAACRRLVQLYKDAGQPEAAHTAEQYLAALQHEQDRLEAKAAATIARLQDASPPPAEMFWLLDNDRDRMWRIEATLLLGLTKWTAPRSSDRDASRHRLAKLSETERDPLMREAAQAALAITPEDVHKVR